MNPVSQYLKRAGSVTLRQLGPCQLIGFGMFRYLHQVEAAYPEAPALAKGVWFSPVPGRWQILNVETPASEWLAASARPDAFMDEREFSSQVLSRI